MKETWTYKGNTWFMRYIEGDGEESEAEIKPYKLTDFNGDDAWAFPSPCGAGLEPIIGEETDRIIVKYEKEKPKMVDIEVKINPETDHY